MTSKCCGNDCEAKTAVCELSTELSLGDVLGTIKVRLGIGRMHYTVAPGLYKIGAADENSPVLVTANFKLTVDILRRELTNRNIWLVVVDTNGINVWCAAGKGTFGTAELVAQLEKVALKSIVAHKTIILPQLCASGVSAFKVQKYSGFSVIFGPIRAKELPAFLDCGMKATEDMRQVKFTFADRMILTPIEIAAAAPQVTQASGVMAILNAFGVLPVDRFDYLGLLGAVVAGVLVTPALLPLIPLRPFSAKGALLGLLWGAASVLVLPFGNSAQVLRIMSYMLMYPAIAAFYAMNFTGCSTFTSPSGVEKEMRQAIPIMLGTLLSGIILRIISFII